MCIDSQSDSYFCWLFVVETGKGEREAGEENGEVQPTRTKDAAENSGERHGPGDQKTYGRYEAHPRSACK